MSGKRPGDEPNVDEYEFYLAEDLEIFDDEGDDPPAPEAKPAAPAPRAPGRPTDPVRRGKPMTALEAIAAAERAEQERVLAAQRDVERRNKAELAARLARDAARRAEERREREEEQEAEEAARWAREAFGSARGAGVPVAGKPAPKAAPPEPSSRASHPSLPAGAVVLEWIQGVDAAVMGPLMRSHERRALHVGALADAIAFAAVCDAIELEPERVGAARVSFGGAEWAVWTQGDGLLAAFQPADVYLVGLTARSRPAADPDESEPTPPTAEPRAVTPPPRPRESTPGTRTTATRSLLSKKGR